MSTRYLDHGAYGAAVFTGYISSVANNDNGVAGAILTVTAITSGVINVGSQISGGAVGDYTLVTGFISGTRGGVGVYTLTKYPTNSNQIVRSTAGLVGKYASVLTTPIDWAVPQEGDGIGKTASTSAATTTLDMASATAVAGNTLSVMGALLTCVASGAAANQFNAGSGATLVANIVAAINRTNNTSTVAAQAIGWGTPKLQDAVFARQGTTTTNLEIMTRAGSAAYNGLTSMAWVGITGLGSSPTWSGGVSGCWGHALNPFAMFPSAIAIYGYGHLGASKPIAGALVAGDTVVNRSGKDIVIPSTGNISLSGLAGTKVAPIRFVIDDSTEWDDDTNPVFFLRSFCVYYLGTTFGPGTGIYCTLEAKQYNDTDYGMVVDAFSSGTTLAITNACSAFSGIKFRQNNTAAVLSLAGGVNPLDADVAQYNRCLFSTPQASSFFAAATNYQNYGAWNFQDCLFSNEGNSGASLEFLGSSTQGIRQQINFTSCRWINFVSGSMNCAGTNACVPALTYFTNCDFGNLGVLGPARLGSQSSVVAGSTQYGKRDFFVNTSRGFVEWTSTRSFPTCTARLLNGVDSWAIHMVPTTTVGVLNRTNPLKAPRIGKINSLADGVRTVTVQLALHEALSWNKSNLSLLVEYVDTSGVMQLIDTFDYLGGALSASIASWSVETGGQVTYVDASVTQYHNKVQFSVVTPTAVATGTEVGFTVCIHTAVAASTHGVFVDPEIGLV